MYIYIYIPYDINMQHVLYGSVVFGELQYMEQRQFSILHIQIITIHYL